MNNERNNAPKPKSLDEAAWCDMVDAFGDFYDSFKAVFRGRKCRLADAALYAASNDDSPQSGAIWRVLARKLRRKYKLPAGTLNEIRERGIAYAKASAAFTALIKPEEPIG